MVPVASPCLVLRPCPPAHPCCPAGVRITKTSIMLGCGETPDEVVATLKTLRCVPAAGPAAVG